MRVHEDILRLVVEGDDDDDETIDEMDPVRARKHLDWLKASYLRNGGWDNNRKVYEETVGKLLGMEAFGGHEAFRGAIRAEKWSLKEKVGNEGRFVPERKWEFIVEGHDCHDDVDVHVNGNGNGIGHGIRSPGLFVPKRLTMNGLRKVSSHWGLKEAKPELLI